MPISWAIYFSFWRTLPLALRDTHVNNVVHIGCGDVAVAAQVEFDHFIPSVGDEICRHLSSRRK